MSTKQRRAEIIRILRGGMKTTMPILAAELGVTVRTISNDILVLTVDEGYPINTEQGKGGGVYLTDYRHPHKHILSKKQIAVLTEIAGETDPERLEVIMGILKAYA